MYLPGSVLRYRGCKLCNNTNGRGLADSGVGVRSRGGTVMTRPWPVKLSWGDKKILLLIAESKARVDAMSPEERAAMLARQRESFSRAEMGFGSDADRAEYRAALESGDPAEIDRVKQKEAARLEAYDKIKDGDK